MFWKICAVKGKYEPNRQSQWDVTDEGNFVVPWSGPCPCQNLQIFNTASTKSRYRFSKIYFIYYPPVPFLVFQLEAESLVSSELRDCAVS